MVAHMALALWPQIQSKRYTKLYKTVALFVLFLSLAYDVHTPHGTVVTVVSMPWR